LQATVQLFQQQHIPLQRVKEGRGVLQIKRWLQEHVSCHVI